MKVLLVDDHPLILSALKAMIEKLSQGVRVTACASAADLRATLRRDAAYDMVLLDLQLDDAIGFDVLTELRRERPDLPVVVISASDRQADVLRAVDLGAMGYLPKRMATEALADALRLVMAGGIFVPPISMQFTDGATPPAEDDSFDGPDVTAPPPPLAYPTAVPTAEQLGLTPRQYDVLLLLLQAKPNKAIARRLGLSVETVKDHVQAVLRGLGVNSRTQAVLAVGQKTQALAQAAREAQETADAAVAKPATEDGTSAA